MNCILNTIEEKIIKFEDKVIEIETTQNEHMMREKYQKPRQKLIEHQ